MDKIKLYEELLNELYVDINDNTLNYKNTVQILIEDEIITDWYYDIETMADIFIYNISGTDEEAAEKAELKADYDLVKDKLQEVSVKDFMAMLKNK